MDLGEAFSESFSQSALSLSEEENDPIPKLKRKRVPRKVQLKVPARHKSLIGLQQDRVHVANALELSRLPCNRDELRKCKQLLRYCNWVAVLADEYRIPSTSGRRSIRTTLNIILRSPIRKVLDLREFPDCYSPNLPIWLYRKIIKSLKLGNRFPLL